MIEIKNDSERVDCTSEKDVGMCRGFILRYYFNSTQQTCESFYYGKLMKPIYFLNNIYSFILLFDQRWMWR